MGIKSPKTKAQEIGVEVHEQIENYLKTGEKKLGSIAMPGLQQIPDPGPDLFIERDIAIDPALEMVARDAEMEGRWEDAAKLRAQASLETAPLRAAGVPIVGFIDCLHARGTNKGGTSIEDVQDPPNTVEVIDWKTTSDIKWIKPAHKMARTPQMTIYGKWVLTVAPRTEHVRLSHVYFVTKGSATPRKVSLRVTPAQINDAWEHVEGLALSLRHAVREPDPDNVPANLEACSKFGGCPARSRCSAGMHAGLRSIAGATAHAALETAGDQMAITLLENIRKQGAAQAAPSPAPAQPSVTLALGGVPSPTVAVPQAPAPVVDAAAQAAAQAAKIAELKAKEERALAEAAFIATCDKVAAHNMGFPALGGEAAAVYGRSKGWPAQETYGGSGQLGAVDPATNQPALMVNDFAVMAQVLDELNTIAAQRAATAAPAQTVTAAQSMGILSPETPAAAIPQTATGPAPSQPASAAPTPPPANAGLGTVAQPLADKPKKEKAKAADKPKTDVPTQAARDGAFVLYVNCAFDGIATTPLHGFVDDLCDALAKQFNAADIRCAPADGPLGYGKWKGALFAYARETADKLPGGAYSIDTRGSEVAEVIVDALRAKARSSGGGIVRGY